MIKAKEVYVTNASAPNSKYVLMRMVDGTLRLNWYDTDSKIVEEEPTLTKRYDNSMKLEFGEKNLFGIRQVLPFIDSKGELEDRWDRIK
jgi:hypothetical protein